MQYRQSTHICFGFGSGAASDLSRVQWFVRHHPTAPDVSLLVRV